MSAEINPDFIFQIQSPVSVLKTEPPEYEIGEIGIDVIHGSSEEKSDLDIKDIDIVSHIIYEDSIKSETVSKDILESSHWESVNTQVFVKAENAPLVKIENISPRENLNITENATDRNVSEGTGEEVVEVQGSNEDFNASGNLSQKFVESRTCKTNLWKDKKEKVKVIKAPTIPYHCNECNCKTYSHQTMKRHKLIHLKPEEIQYFYCYHCSYKTMRKGDLKTHMSRHLKNDQIKREKRYHCDKCGYYTYTNPNLNAHKLIHLKPEEIQYFYCYHCSYKSKRKGTLKSHIVRHFKNTDVPFHCYKCDFITLKRKSIIEHIKKHSKHHSKCDNIKYKYKFETHTGKYEKRYCCEKCDYKTHTRFLLKRHKLIHVKPEDIQYFHCYHCSQKCKRRGSLQVHIIRHFKKEEVAFHCYICDYMTPKRDLIAKHIQKHFKVPIKSEIKEEN